MTAGNLDKIVYLLSQSQKVLTVIHEDPDGDAIGSALALAETLVSMAKEVDIACADSVPEVFKFLPSVKKIRSNFDNINNYDLVVALDCGDLKRTGFTEEITHFASAEKKLVNIDHHRKSDLHKIASVNFTDEAAASSAQLVYEIIKALKKPITPTIATSILCGLYTDTGGFRHANTSPETLELASLLMERGGRLQAIRKNLDNHKSMGTLKLWGQALSRIKRLRAIGAVSSIITKKDFVQANADVKDLAGLVNLITSAAGASAGILLTQIDDNTIKVSLRTERSDIDLAQLAEIFGGGGHKKAAGFTISGKIIEDKKGWKVELG